MAMKRILGGVLLLTAAVVSAQVTGYWRASNSSAKSTTGDIGIGTDKVSIDFMTFTIAEIRDLKPAEVSAVFDADAATAVPGKLYRVEIPGDRAFLHKNRLCGSDETQWMATDVIGRELHVAFFSGAKMPELTPEAMNNNSELCGVFVYSR
jgi:hypothetical protein